MPVASCGLPAGIGRAALERLRRGPGGPPLDLAPGGVCRAARVTPGAGALLPHRFTLTSASTGGLFSVALSRGSPRVGVTDHPALWSPDFPRQPGGCRDRPADSSHGAGYAGQPLQRHGACRQDQGRQPSNAASRSSASGVLPCPAPAPRLLAVAGLPRPRRRRRPHRRRPCRHRRGACAGSRAAPSPTCASCSPARTAASSRASRATLDRMLIDSQLSAIHAAPPGQGVARAARRRAQQAAALPTAQAPALAGDVEAGARRSSAPTTRSTATEQLGWKELGGRTISLATDPRDAERPHASGPARPAAASGARTDGGKTLDADLRRAAVHGHRRHRHLPHDRLGLRRHRRGQHQRRRPLRHRRLPHQGRRPHLGARRRRTSTRRAPSSTSRSAARRRGDRRQRLRRDERAACSPSLDGGDSYTDVALPTNEDGTAPYTLDPLRQLRHRRARAARRARRRDRGRRLAARQGGRTPPATPTASATASTARPRAARPGTWTRMDTNLGEAPLAPGLSDDPIGRTSLAYASGEGQDHDVLWAVVQDAGLFRNETFLGVGRAGQADRARRRLPQPGQRRDVARSRRRPAQFGAAPGTVDRCRCSRCSPARASRPGTTSTSRSTRSTPNRVIIGLEEIYSTVAQPLPAGPGDLQDDRPLLEHLHPRSRDCEGAPTYEGKTTHPDQHAAAFAHDARRRPPLRLRRRRRLRPGRRRRRLRQPVVGVPQRRLHDDAAALRRDERRRHDLRRPAGQRHAQGRARRARGARWCSAATASTSRSTRRTATSSSPRRRTARSAQHRRRPHLHDREHRRHEPALLRAVRDGPARPAAPRHRRAPGRREDRRRQRRGLHRVLRPRHERAHRLRQPGLRDRRRGHRRLRRASAASATSSRRATTTRRRFQNGIATNVQPGCEPAPQYRRLLAASRAADGPAQPLHHRHRRSPPPTRARST